MEQYDSHVDTVCLQNKVMVCAKGEADALLYLSCELASTEPQCIIKLAEN